MVSNELKTRLNRWMNGKPQPPYKVIMFPTSRCNLNCRFCKSKRFLEDELSTEEWMEIVEDAIDLGVEEWWITGGGEPLVREEVTLRAIEKIKNSGGYCELMSNGTLLDRDIANKLVSFGLDKILLSLDGPNANINDNIRGEGSFEGVLSAIDFINNFKEERSKDKPKIQISSVVNHRNFDNIEEMINLALSLEVDELELHQMLVYDDTRDKVSSLLMNKDEKRYLSERIKELEDKYSENDLYFNGDALKLSLEDNKSCGSREDIKGIYCLQPFYNILIDMLGEVAPCCPGGSASKDVKLPKKGLKEVWYGKYFSKIRENIKKGNKLSFCENCGVNNLRNDILEEISS